MPRPYRFNPGFQSDKEAVDNFVVRLDELTEILALLAIPQGSIATRALIIAPRGAGKTTLCKRILAGVRLTADLSATWQPIFLAEESYSVTTPGEFFLECLFHLKEQTTKSDLETRYAAALAAKDEEDLLRSSFDALKAYSGASGKRILIIVENFHTILREQIGDDAHFLINTLLSTDFLSVIATSTAVADKKESTFFESFRILELQPLSIDECHRLWTFLTKQEVNRERVRPLQILTGGSPRLLHILAEFMRTPSLHDLMENLNLLIDQNTEYFRSQLDALPALERKVFAALLDTWDPSTAKQIADIARVNTNIASAMLARLHERGAVIKEPGQGRAAIYYAAERLFNIYYLMRRRTHPSSRVRALVAFMTQYYDRDELLDTTAQLVREACSIEPKSRGDYHFTFSAILNRAPKAIRKVILEQTPADFLHSFRQDPELPYEIRTDNDLADHVVEDLFERADIALDNKDFARARDLIETATKTRPDLAEPWVRLSMLEAWSGEPERAIEAAQSAVALDTSHSFSHLALGISLASNNNLDTASQALERAIELDPDSSQALNELAKVRQRQNNFEDAILLFRRAFEKGGLSNTETAHFGRFLVEQGNAEEAETILRKASGLTIEHRETRRALVELLDSKGKSEEAIRILRQAADSTNAWQAWTDIGLYLLSKGGDAVGARAAVETATELNSGDPMMYRLLAFAVKQSGGAQEDAKALVIRLIENLGDQAVIWMIAGEIYELYRLPIQAEEAYRRATITEGGEIAWLPLGRLLASQTRRTEEAEAALRRAVDVTQDKCGPMKELAEFLMHRGEENLASDILEQAVSKNPSCYCSRVLQGEMAYRDGRISEAEKRFKGALDLNPDGILALTGLARISDKQIAEDLIARAIRADSKDPRSLFARALLSSRPIEERLADGQAALDIEPQFTEARLFLASLIAESGQPEAALSHLSVALDELPLKRELISQFVDTALGLAKHGLDHRVSHLLESQEGGKMVEPLAVALKLSRGEHPTVAKEILEVAQDIATSFGR